MAEQDLLMFRLTIHRHSKNLPRRVIFELLVLEISMLRRSVEISLRGAICQKTCLLTCLSRSKRVSDYHHQNYVGHARKTFAV